MKRTVRINLMMLTLTLIFIMVFSITGKASGRFNSQGRIIFNNKTTTTKDDVIFDASDFEKLAQVCK